MCRPTVSQGRTVKKGGFLTVLVLEKSLKGGKIRTQRKAKLKSGAKKKGRTGGKKTRGGPVKESGKQQREKIENYRERGFGGKVGKT